MTRIAAAFLAALLFALSLAAGAAAAADRAKGEVTVHEPWARASAGRARAGAAYFTIANMGEKPDRLVAAASPVARPAQFHTHSMEDGIMKMRHVMAVEVAPGEPTVFKPGGLHVMLMGLKAPLRKGESFPLSLTFERAGKIELRVMIQGVGAMGPGKTGRHGKHGS